MDDQVGSDHFLQGTEAAQPYLVTAFDGKPALSFPPTLSTFMSITSGLTFNDRSFSVFIVRRSMMSIQQCLWSGRNATFDAYGHIANTAFSGYMEGGNKVSANPAIVNLEVQGFRGGTAAQGGTSVLWSNGRYDSATTLGNYTFTEGVDLGRKYHPTTPLRYWYGDIHAVALFDHYLSNADVAQVMAAFKSRYPALRQTWAKRLLIEGDSILCGSDGNADTRNVPACLAHTNSDWQVHCMAVSGALLDGTTNQNGIDVRQALTSAFYDNVNFTRNALILMGGRNDVITQDAATTYARLSTVVSTYVAQGWEVYVCTLIDTTSTTARARIITLNDLIRADLATDTSCAGVIDVAANAAFDPLLSAAADATYYEDSSHLTPAGNKLLGSLISPVLA